MCTVIANIRRHPVTHTADVIVDVNDGVSPIAVQARGGFFFSFTHFSATFLPIREFIDRAVS